MSPRTKTQPTQRDIFDTLASLAWERLPPNSSFQTAMMTMASLWTDERTNNMVQERAALQKMRPQVVCLCGSNRFWRDYIEQSILETLAGRIVLSVGGYTAKSVGGLPTPPGYLCVEMSAEQKARMDELHLCKIDLADEVLILNRGGYIGDSTRAELAYALAHDKKVRWLEPQQRTEGEA